MTFEKFKESIPAKPTLRSGILDLVLFYSVNERDSFIPTIPPAKAKKAEEKCLALFKKHKDELVATPAQELKELMTQLSRNCQSKIFHIINCFTDEQIKELFDTPENMSDGNGNYNVGRSYPYAFTGLIGGKVSGGWLDYAKIFEGYMLLRKNHSIMLASLVTSASLIGNGMENSFFNDSGVDSNKENIYAVRLKKITEFFEANKEHLQQSYGSVVDTPLKWMDAFLAIRSEPSPESYVLREGIKSYAEQLRLERVVPIANSKKSVMKI